jgi:transmembrane sensor
MDAGPLTPAAQAELDCWLAQDERHQGALFRATVAWRMLDRASVLGSPAAELQVAVADLTAHRVGEDAEVGHKGVGRRGFLWGGGAIAASLIATAVGWRMTISDMAMPGQRVQTARGEIRRVSLADGSRATLNTDSSLAIHLGKTSRKMSLDSGEAWFEVANDARRPFVVAAGEVRARAVGTAFSVHRVTGGAEIRVTEGTVEVWVAGREDRRRVDAGAHAFVAEVTGPQQPVADAPANERKLAWRDGALSFEGDPLGAAAAEFNRYNRVTLTIDPALAGEKIVGRFHLDEPGEFARAVSIALDTNITREGDTIHIARR